MTRRITLTILGLLAVVAVAALYLRREPPPTAVGSGPPGREMAAAYVGREACLECHEAAHTAWVGSHHDLAMQPATDETVLGDFGDAEHDHFGLVTRFFRRDGKFMVRTAGADGVEQDFEVAYTFGAVPLQQYLIRFDDGRLQALSVCWDTRDAAAGGGRWFHLYPDEAIPPGDALHWTGAAQNWNHSCAECHSTHVRKGFDAASGTYETTWSEIDVSCESCHGPGSVHIAWERGELSDERLVRGLVVDLADRDGGTWSLAPEDRIAKRTPPRSGHAEIERCARCHSRRSQLHEDTADTIALTDSHRPSLLDGPLYYPDGQIQDEVFVYGSFVQSKMYAAGVTCRDCHDPHSQKVYAADNVLCARCHSQAAYDTTEHHHHPVGSTGAACIECHMPARTYMVVDPRRDHSMKVPRPDLSLALGVPNACTGCHDDRTDEWAAEEVAAWPGAAEPAPHFAFSIAAGRSGGPGAAEALAALAGNVAEPAIVRATAVSLLRPGDSALSRSAVERAAVDESPLVRLAALIALADAQPELQEEVATPLLADASRAVRQEASRLVRRNLSEWLATQHLHADRAESNLNLGTLHLEQGDLAAAERAYETAIARNPGFAPASVNLSDLHRMRGDDAAGERVLRAALAGEPRSPELHHSLGLLLIRTGRPELALHALARAAELAPEVARFAYVHGVALIHLDQRPAGLAVLRHSLTRHPGDFDLLNALVSYALEDGDQGEARSLVDRLLQLSPEDPAVLALDRQLRGQ